MTEKVYLTSFCVTF